MFVGFCITWHQCTILKVGWSGTFWFCNILQSLTPNLYHNAALIFATFWVYSLLCVLECALKVFECGDLGCLCSVSLPPRFPLAQLHRVPTPWLISSSPALILGVQNPFLSHFKLLLYILPASKRKKNYPLRLRLRCSNKCLFVWALISIFFALHKLKCKLKKPKDSDLVCALLRSHHDKVADLTVLFCSSL